MNRNFFQEEYLGGATPFERPLDVNRSKLQVVMVNFDSSDALIELKFNGDDDYTEVVLSEVDNKFKYVDSKVVGIRISGLPTVDPENAYKITATQWD